MRPRVRRRFGQEGPATSVAAPPEHPISQLPANVAVPDVLPPRPPKVISMLLEKLPEIVAEEEAESGDAGGGDGDSGDAKGGGGLFSQARPLFPVSGVRPAVFLVARARVGAGCP